MEFELKKVQTVGGVLSNNDGNFTQHINVTIGVKECPYADIKTEKTIQYVFPGTLTATEIEAGIPVFAQNWVAENYPTV